MNQILEIGNEKRKSTKKNNKINKNGTNRVNRTNGTSQDKVIKIFAVILIVFAVILITSGVIGVMKNKKEAENQNAEAVPEVNATINAIMDEANSQVILTVQSDIEISKVIYNWNTNTEKTIDGQNQTEIEKTIELPSGSNTLNVKVIDVEGNETKDQFDFESESGDDIINPEITLEATGSTLTITATDETKMSFLTYRWNDDEETTVKVDDVENMSDSDDDKTIIVELEIPEGTNTITVVAVDASSKYNTRTETKTINGLLDPEVNYELSDDGSQIIFHCTHDKGIKSVKVTLNGEEYEQNYTEQDGYQTDLTINLDWVPGHNTVKLEVTSVDDTVGTFEGEYDYENSSSSSSGNTTNSTNTAGNNTNTSNNTASSNTNN